jgi:hypothetical protein
MPTAKPSSAEKHFYVSRSTTQLLKVDLDAGISEPGFAIGMIVSQCRRLCKR